MEILTIDERGRVQIPETVREQIGLDKEDRLLLEVQDGKLILQPFSKELKVYNEGGVLVVKSEPTGNLETIIDDLRSERITDLTL